MLAPALPPPPHAKFRICASRRATCSLQRRHAACAAGGLTSRRRRTKVFRPRTPPEAIDLISRLLEYTPSARLTAVEALCHPFFDELRTGEGRMPNGRDMPALFNWTKEGE